MRKGKVFSEKKKIEKNVNMEMDYLEDCDMIGNDILEMIVVMVLRVERRRILYVGMSVGGL